jgi:hypothetical protein
MLDDVVDPTKIDPLQIVRLVNGERVFGLKPSALKSKIEAGEIPMPIPLSDSGRALGWTGQQILDHHARMAALAEERAAQRLAFRVPTTKKPPIRKQKLRPPVANKSAA